MQGIIDVSKDGRIALGWRTAGGPVVLVNLGTGRTLRTLRSGPNYAYASLSSTGRYVAFTRAHRRGSCTYWRPWVYDRVTGKSRLAASSRSGAALRPSWSQSTGCATISASTPEPMGVYFHSGVRGPGMMSPDARYVVFCANLAVATRGDLYIKDLRTRKLTRRAGVCSLSPGEDEPALAAPQVSEAGRTILLPANPLGSTVTYRASVLLNRKTLRPVTLPGDVAAERIQLTDDGRSIYYQAGAGMGAWRYDVASGTSTGLVFGDPMRGDEISPGQEYRDPEWITRRGRYVAYYGSRVDDPAIGRELVVGVFDRDTGVATDLTAAAVAAGMPRRYGQVPATPTPVGISGDGKVVFLHTANGVVAVPWMT